jgi:hypothetical protein
MSACPFFARSLKRAALAAFRPEPDGSLSIELAALHLIGGLAPGSTAASVRMQVT